MIPDPQHSDKTGRRFRRAVGDLSLLRAQIDNMSRLTWAVEPHFRVRLSKHGAARGLLSRQATYGADDSPLSWRVRPVQLLAAAHRHGLAVPEPACSKYDTVDAMGHRFRDGLVKGETWRRKSSATQPSPQAVRALAGRCPIRGSLMRYRWVVAFGNRGRTASTLSRRERANTDF